MKVFYSDRHRLHAPAWYVADGRVRECPEVAGRVEGILGVLRGKGHGVVLAEGVEVREVVGRVHDEGYLEYLRTIHGVWVEEFGDVPVVPDTFVRRAGMILPRRPEKMSAQAGFYCFDMAAPIVAGTWEAAMGSAGCAVGAAEAVLGGESGAYAVCRPPGHHAGRDYCGGFCYLNNVAVAAERLVMGGKRRVAILDVDYHHGNGTQDIFYGRGDVLFVSVHAEPGTQYPYFWGYAEEVGEGAGKGATANFPLKRGASEGEWMTALDLALERVRGFGAEVLLVSLGADVYAGDGVGDFGVSVEGFLEIGRRVRTLGVPTVFVQEGGYNVGRIGECVGEVLRGFEGGENRNPKTEIRKGLGPDGEGV